MRRLYIRVIKARPKSGNEKTIMFADILGKDDKPHFYRNRISRDFSSLFKDHVITSGCNLDRICDVR